MSIEVTVDGVVVYQESDRLRHVLEVCKSISETTSVTLDKVNLFQDHLEVINSRLEVVEDHVKRQTLRGQQIMATLQDLQTHLQSVATGVSNVATLVAELRQKIAEGTTVTQGDLDNLDSTVQGVQTALDSINTPTPLTPEAARGMRGFAG